MNNGPFTEQEADAELARRKRTPPDRFCPLIQDRCRIDCVCFVDPERQGHSETQNFVYGGCCGNGMFDERPSLQL